MQCNTFVESLELVCVKPSVPTPYAGAVRRSGTAAFALPLNMYTKSPTYETFDSCVEFFGVKSELIHILLTNSRYF